MFRSSPTACLPRRKTRVRTFRASRATYTRYITNTSRVNTSRETVCRLSDDGNRDVKVLGKTTVSGRPGRVRLPRRRAPVPRRACACHDDGDRVILFRSRFRRRRRAAKLLHDAVTSFKRRRSEFPGIYEGTPYAFSTRASRAIRFGNGRQRRRTKPFFFFFF